MKYRKKRKVRENENISININDMLAAQEEELRRESIINKNPLRKASFNLKNLTNIQKEDMTNTLHKIISSDHRFRKTHLRPKSVAQQDENVKLDHRQFNPILREDFLLAETMRIREIANESKDRSSQVIQTNNSTENKSPIEDIKILNDSIIQDDNEESEKDEISNINTPLDSPQSKNDKKTSKKLSTNSPLDSPLNSPKSKNKKNNSKKQSDINTPKNTVKKASISQNNSEKEKIVSVVTTVTKKKVLFEQETVDKKKLDNKLDTKIKFKKEAKVDLEIARAKIHNQSRENITDISSLNSNDKTQLKLVNFEQYIYSSKFKKNLIHQKQLLTNQILNTLEYGELIKIINKRAPYEMLSCLKIDKSKSHVHGMMGHIQRLIELDHPNIIDIQEVFQDSNYIYIILEQIEVQDLNKFQLTQGYLSEGLALKFIVSILRVLTYLKNKNILLSNLKSESFIVQKDGDGSYELKLYDLGWGQNMIEESDCVWFRAPESSEGQYSNVWAAGVMQQIMLHGFPPFYKQSVDKTTFESEEKEFLRTVFDPYINIKFQEKIPLNDTTYILLKNMLNKDHSKRWTSNQCLNQIYKEYGFKDALSSDLQTLLNNKYFNFQSDKTLFKFRRTVCILIVKQLAPSNLSKYQKMWNKIDRWDRGVLSKNVIIDQFEWHVSEEFNQDKPTVERMVKFMDVDGNDLIQWTEFASAMLFFTDMSKEERQIRLAFELMDSDKKGYIARSDLYKITGFNEEYNNQLFSSIDINANNSIEYDEFYDIMSKKIDY